MVASHPVTLNRRPPAPSESLAGDSLVPASRIRDIAALLKLRITSLVVLTAWAGFFLASAKSGKSSLTLLLLHSLVGIALTSGGASALNQVIEREADGKMLRTRQRPLPTGRMRPWQAAALAIVLMISGGAYLFLTANPLTSLLALATAATYLGAYTPLKKVSPISTFVGAFPGAMPPLLGWVAARGKVEWEAFALFAIVFVWQFPHFHSIAWLYREDYERAGIRMLPVVDNGGQATIRDILLYSVALIPISLLPVWLHVSGNSYLVGAILLGGGLLSFGIRLARLKLGPAAPSSKKYARNLLQATVIYLPLLFILMMVDSIRK